jgi:coenzyme Q-binding protein COQ10
MFDLVCDVEHYPEFVPLCKSLAVKSSKERNDKSLIVADMTMAYQMLSETFTTQVLMDRSALKIDVKYIDGPFKRLENVWSFKEVDTTSCDVNFMIDYELRSKLLAAAAGAIFDRAFAKFVDAFETRANEVYGKA